MQRAAKRLALCFSVVLLPFQALQVEAVCLSADIVGAAGTAAVPATPTAGGAKIAAPADPDGLRGPMAEPDAASESGNSVQSTGAAPVTESSRNSVYTSRGIVNQVNDQQGILSNQSQGHHGLLRRALGGAASDVGHATVALLGATILNQSPDLPPDDASKPEWPFNEPNRKALAYVNWADGSTAKMARLPDGSLQIIGSGKRYVLQPEGDGAFAMMGDYGSMASVTPRLDGGYTIIRADGRSSQVLPREGGGFNVVNSAGRITATILPGPGGKHMIRGNGMSDGFLN